MPSPLERLGDYMAQTSRDYLGAAIERGIRQEAAEQAARAREADARNRMALLEREYELRGDPTQGRMDLLEKEYELRRKEREEGLKTMMEEQGRHQDYVNALQDELNADMEFLQNPVLPQQELEKIRDDVERGVEAGTIIDGDMEMDKRIKEALKPIIKARQTSARNKQSQINAIYRKHGVFPRTEIYRGGGGIDTVGGGEGGLQAFSDSLLGAPNPAPPEAAGEGDEKFLTTRAGEWMGDKAYDLKEYLAGLLLKPGGEAAAMESARGIGRQPGTGRDDAVLGAMPDMPGVVARGIGRQPGTWRDAEEEKERIRDYIQAVKPPRY